MTATLNSFAPSGGQLINLSTGNLLSAPASVTIPAGSLSTSFTVTSGNDNGTANVNASATGLTGSSVSVEIQVRGFTLVSPLVGIDRAVTATITLDQAAPSGGATFNLSVDDISIAKVSPASITIPEGQTTGTFQLTGGTGKGFTIVRADGTANGYVRKTLNISVTDHLIDLPAASNAYLGSIISVPVLISPDQAPAGGVVITVTSSNPDIIQVVTPTVTIPEGTFQATVQVRAVTGAAGSATITASNPDFAPDVMVATITSGLDIMESFATFGSTETDTLHLQLVNGNPLFPAPAGGVQITLISSDASCAVVTSPTTIATGNIFATATLSYGGSAALPCTATVTASNALFGTDSVQVTVGQSPDLGAMTITDPWQGYLRVGSGLQKQMRLNLATSSHGGVTVQIKSDNPAFAKLAADATSLGKPVIELTVPNGQSYIDFYVQGGLSATGNVTLTARNIRFSPGAVTITVVQPVFAIAGLTTPTTSLAADNEFYVQAGILNTAGTAVQVWQPVSAEGPLPVTFTSSTPAVGQMATSSARGASVTVNMPVNQYYTPTTMANGGVAFDALTGGSTTVSVTASGFNSSWSGASQTITITQPGITITDPWQNYLRVGGGLQKQMRVTLGGSSHGGVTVHLASSNSAVLRLSTSATVAGSAAIDVPIANGQTTYDFYVQGVRGASGDATITATQALFTNGAVTITVVQPVFAIAGLTTPTTSLAADNEFYVQAGILNTAGTAVQTWQPVSAEGPLPVTFTSSTPAVGQMATSSARGASVTVNMPVNQYYTPTTMANGGVAFDALTGGSTTVSVTASGFNSSWSGASQTITITQPGITITDPWQNYLRVGGGLQKQMRVTLGGSSHGGVTVHLASSNSAVLRLSTSATVAGSAAIDVPIANGQTTYDFYVQGVRGASGDATITATQALFTNGAVTITVVQPVFAIAGLTTPTTSLAADNEFYVQAGILNTTGTAVQTWQPVSAEGPLPVTFTSSTPAVGQMATSSARGASVTVNMPVNQYYTPTTMATGGVAFDALTGGSTTVSATASGFNNSWSGASQAITVTQTGITITDPWQNYLRVGGGLQKQMRVTLGGSSHGGVTVHLASSNSAVLRLSTSATVAGSATIDVPIANGQTTYDFYVQGVRGASGDATITATQALFTNGAVTITVVQPVFAIAGLTTPTTSLAADNEFYVQAGILNTTGTAVQTWQPVSAEGPLPVTFTSSTPAVGQMATSSARGASVTVNMPVNQYYTPTTMATGGVAFDALTGGSTTVSATASGFNNSWSGASQAITVTQTGITITDPWQNYLRVGGGLQKQMRVTLGGSSHGGVTVRIASSNTTKLLLAADATTPGVAFIDLFIADGQTIKDFYIQGINGVTGTVNVTATQALFTTGTTAIEVVQSVAQVVGLPASIAAGSANSAFYVQTGILNATGNAVQVWQPVSPAGPIQVLLTSSNAAVAQLVTNVASGAQVTVGVPINQYYSPTTRVGGGVEFDPLAIGNTTVSTSVTGFNNGWSGATTAVTVTQ